MANFEVGDAAFSGARRFSNGGRRNLRPLLAEGRSTSTSRNRSGSVERLSVRDRRNGPPLAPPSKGGEKERGARSKGGETPPTFAAGYLRSLSCKFSTGHPWPPLLRAGKLREHSRREISGPYPASFQQAPPASPSSGDERDSGHTDRVCFAGCSDVRGPGVVDGRRCAGPGTWLAVAGHEAAHDGG